MAFTEMTLAEARKSARVDTAKLSATTQTDIERQALEDGADDFRPFPPIARTAKRKSPERANNFSYPPSGSRCRCNFDDFFPKFRKEPWRSNHAACVGSIIRIAFNQVAFAQRFKSKLNV